MADTKFHCPECKQKIAVHEEAAGEKIDCPRCCSTIVIPHTSGAPVKVEVRRQLAVLAGVQTDLYSIIEEQQKKVRAVEAESVKIRADSQRAQADIRMMREELGALQHQREALAARLTNAEAAREAASAAQVQLAQFRQEVATLRSARDEAAARAAKAEELSQMSRERLVSDERARSDSKAQLDAALAERDAAQARASKADELSQAIRERLANDERARADAKAQLDSATAERDAARRDLLGAQKGIDEMRSRLKEREASYIKASLAAEGARHELEKLRNAPPPPPVKDEAMERKFEQAQTRLQAQAKQIEAAKSALIAAAADRDSAQKRAGELQTSLAEAAGRAAASQIDKTRVENALSTVSKAYEKSRRELATLQQRLADLEFGAVATTTTMPDPAPASSAGPTAPTSTEFSEAEQRLYLMREEINLLQDKLSKTEESARNSKSLIEETERHLNDSQAKCRALAAERDRLAAALGQVANGGIETAESRLLGSDRDHSQAAIAALEARLRRSAEYLRQVEAERDELKVDLAEARKASQRLGDEARA